MKDQRSGSQILYGFLPQQTGDLKGGVWRTVDWKDPLPVDVEDSLIRRRLIEEIVGWTTLGADPAIEAQLRNGFPIEVIEVNPDRGVRVERFPEVWVCQECRRVDTGTVNTCRCGQKRWRQLHFVGYHECGLLESPNIARCKVHHDARMVHQSSMDASRIVFDCPECGAQLQKGLGWRRCPCGKKYTKRANAEMLVYQVHRAGSVYSPQAFTMINPASRTRMRELNEAGGRRRSLTWALAGFADRSPVDRRPTRSSLVDTLLAGGLTREVAERMAGIAVDAGELGTEDHLGALAEASSAVIETVEQEAVDIALGLLESRIRVEDLARGSTSERMAGVYGVDYPEALTRAGLTAIDFTDRFPVLKGVYGFTRGGDEPGSAKLSMFTGKRGRRIYAQLQQAEALFFQLDPMRVHRWMSRRAHHLTAANDQRAARAAVAASVDIPSRFIPQSEASDAGRDLLTLLHSYAHRAIRQIAVFAGVDREGLGEYLVPRHCGFFLYAATRGDFVLGGLQAVFENDLHHMLNTVVGAESRCPLDPACQRNGGACHACLHLGEPTCDHFNRYLDRDVLFGSDGFLAA